MPLKTIQIPFGPPGVQQHYPSNWYSPGSDFKPRDIIWKDNYEFEGWLRVLVFLAAALLRISIWSMISERKNIPCS